MIKSQRFTSIVTAKEKISSKVYLLKFKLISPPEIEFLAGQTVMFLVADGVNRNMSMASPPSIKNELLMCSDVSPGGILSQWVINAKLGDQMSFVGPLGVFTLDKTSPRKIVMIATGSGIAPFRSMLYDYLEVGGKNEVMLYWGLRFPEDVFWQEELEGLSQKYPNFHYLTTLSQPTEAWTGKRGRVEGHIFGQGNNLSESDYYLCGSKEMIVEVREKLLATGVPKEQIKTELFY